jgi:hypothetical protein
MNDQPYNVKVIIRFLDGTTTTLYSREAGTEYCNGRMIYWNTNGKIISYNTNQIFSIEEE